MDTTLARPHGGRGVKPVPRLLSSDIHPPPEIEPRVLLHLGLVLRPLSIVALQDARIDELHGAHGVGAKGDAGADLSEGGRGLVDVNVQVWVTEEANGKGEATNAAAADGDGDFGVGLGHIELD